MDGQERFTLAEIGGGATVERFDLAMQEVLDNIQDPNTDPEKARSVTLKVIIKPNKYREVGEYEIDVDNKLVKGTPLCGRVFLGRDKDGRGVASEDHPSQVEMDITKPQADQSTVYKLEGGKR